MKAHKLLGNILKEKMVLDDKSGEAMASRIAQTQRLRAICEDADNSINKEAEKTHKAMLKILIADNS